MMRGECNPLVSRLLVRRCSVGMCIPESEWRRLAVRGRDDRWLSCEMESAVKRLEPHDDETAHPRARSMVAITLTANKLRCNCGCSKQPERKERKPDWLHTNALTAALREQRAASPPSVVASSSLDS